MDIASLAIALGQSSAQNKIGAALMKMSMNDTQQVAGQMAQILGESDVNPNVGNVIDVTA